ncbi:hypothetical protein KIPB_008274 [Kipferlia bialata]|uniref:Cyclic nucleotide-binding domain-containing protein n=1 Tax=Kipferlia bialata TaxID=797122 RepID=A0A9K3D1M3_9EUKA|nr:hypothetical protein KIPB_008274 [Kipferlia bialata]|eukprot:g8274.t1
MTQDGEDVLFSLSLPTLVASFLRSNLGEALTVEKEGELPEPPHPLSQHAWAGSLPEDRLQGLIERSTRLFATKDSTVGGKPGLYIVLSGRVQTEGAEVVPGGSFGVHSLFYPCTPAQLVTGTAMEPTELLYLARHVYAEEQIQNSLGDKMAFPDLHQRSMRALSCHMRTKTYATGETILTAGSKVDTLSLIVSGSVSLGGETLSCPSPIALRQFLLESYTPTDMVAEAVTVTVCVDREDLMREVPTETYRQMQQDYA